MFLTPQDYFRLHDARPRKRFGQHFLAQPKTAERIVLSAQLESSETAVEVGPGLGALTAFILERVRRLHLVELDRDLAGYLESSLSPSEPKAVVHRQDVLEFDFLSVAREEGSPLVVLGNLPYNISSPLVFRLLESMTAIKRAVFMVQKEVGERFASGPGTKDYGVLSVLLGVYARVSALFLVGPGQFYPPPKVESLVVRMDFLPETYDAGPPFDFLRKLVSAAFQQRRKTLQNSLKGMVGDAGILAKAFEERGIDPRRRPESLTPAEFSGLAGAIFRLSGRG